MQGMKIEGTRTGPMLVDLATGLVLDSKLDGKMSLSGTQEQGGMKVTMDGTGTGSTAATGELLSGGGTGTATGSTASPVPTPAATPAATATPSAPPTPASGGGSLAPGSYAGDGLTVTVLPDNGLAMSKGKLTMTGRVTSVSGDALSGTFTHEGASYDFTGKRTADGMTLTTGGKTYALKMAGSNPLAE